MSRECQKKLGSYEPKSQLLGLRKPNVDWKSTREDFFEGLDNTFLSDKTPIFFTFSVHKGVVYICKKEF